MYKILIFPITEILWRWEIRRGHALRCCGTARSKAAARIEANDVVDA